VESAYAAELAELLAAAEAIGDDRGRWLRADGGAQHALGERHGTGRAQQRELVLRRKNRRLMTMVMAEDVLGRHARRLELRRCEEFAERVRLVGLAPAARVIGTAPVARRGTWRRSSARGGTPLAAG
jgi:hypothetical protein